jgi:(p)ppGpp synthase/HD superfamily hydrolase
MTRTEQAVQIALQAHATQVRKSDNSPYVVHPIMVAHILAQHGFSDTVCAAALVHDVLEDTEMTRDELVRALGEEVVQVVDAVSEDASLQWEERKAAYAKKVGESSEGAKAVSIGDKIHNLQSLLDTHKEQGPSLWSKFNRGKDQKLWFEELMLQTFRDTWQHPLVDEYAELVEKMRTLE